MPSQPANEIVVAIEDVLGQMLTTEQKLQCEELAINVYVGAAKRHIARWAASLQKKGKAFTFDHFYVPIMNGIIVGGMRIPREKQFKFDTPLKKMMYAAIHTYLGSGFTMKELEDVVWFTQHTTLKELQAAIAVAQHCGVINGAYIRAIIVGNRRRAAALLRVKDSRFKKITEDPPDVLTGVPNVKSLQDAWTKRLKSAVDRSTDEDVERNAERKLQI